MPEQEKDRKDLAHKDPACTNDLTWYNVQQRYRYTYTLSQISINLALRSTCRTNERMNESINQSNRIERVEHMSPPTSGTCKRETYMHYNMK